MTDSTVSPIDLRSLKDEARRLSRAPDGPSYCQALDGLARGAGHPHWKAMASTAAATGKTMNPPSALTMDVSLEAARRSAAKLNAMISRALGVGSRADPLALRAVLRDRDMSMDDRIAAAARTIVPMPETSTLDHEAAVLLVAAIAHDAVVHGDLTLMPWRTHARELDGGDLLRAVEGMWSAGDASMPDGPQSDEAWNARIEASTSAWFSMMAASAAERGRERLAGLLADLSKGVHARRIGVLDLVRPLRLLMEQDRAAFETMLAERYAARTSRPAADHREDARATLDVHLDDEGIAFGDPSIGWDRDHANELADTDMEHWEP